MPFKSLLLFLAFSAALLAVIAAETPTSAEEKWRRLMEGPHVKRGTLPDLKLLRSSTATAAEAVQIRKHIFNLASVERPDIGLSGTMGGTAFAPVQGTAKHAGGFRLTNHQLQTSDDFRQLVALGPRALPFLLEALEDKTPTKLKQTSNSRFGGMSLCTELGGNPTNSIEQKAIASLPKREISFGDGRSVTDHTVTIGDVCFVAIGQIVGRAYLAVRYQPTAIIVVNSPTEEQSLAKAVRDIWSSTNATQRLFDSLLFDYATEGVYNGESLDGWSIGSSLQSEAALRLLYYFPQEASALIAGRLARLDVRGDKGNLTNFMRREVANGVRTKDFIKAVSWSDQPVIKQALQDIFERTTDPEILELRP